MSERGLLAKAGSAISAFFVVPLVATLLFCWTVVGFLCSLKECGVFVYVSVLVVTAGLIDTRMGQDDYAFDSSLLDPLAVLVAAYLCYRVLLRHHDTNASLAGSRRLASIPVATAVAAFLSVKIVAVARNEAQDRQGWKLAWLWLALVSSAFVYASMARWWTDASMPRLQEAEAALLKKYAQVEFEQSVVAGLGTVCVKGFHQSFEAGVPPSGEAAPEKPVLVLLHGYAAGNGFWMFVLKELSSHFRVVCVEMYGCGRSERLPFKAKGPAETEKILVESLEKWRAEMGITEMVLCGHSLGGMMASAYAMSHPYRLRKLFLLSPAGIGGVPMDGDTGKDRLVYKIYSFFWTRGVGFLFLLRWAGPLGMRAAKIVVARRLSWVPEAAKIREVDSDLLGEYVYQLLALPASGEKIIFPLLDPMLHAYRPVLETLKGGGGGASESATASATSSSHGGGGRVQRGEGAPRSAAEEEGRGISCPVSIIYGSPDHDWMPHRHGIALAESLTRQGVTAKVYSVPEAGHTLIIDNPEDFTRIFLEAYFDAGV